jgi:hypothetical protein
VVWKDAFIQQRDMWFIGAWHMCWFVTHFVVRSKCCEEGFVLQQFFIVYLCSSKYIAFFVSLPLLVSMFSKRVWRVSKQRTFNRVYKELCAKFSDKTVCVAIDVTLLAVFFFVDSACGGPHSILFPGSSPIRGIFACSSGTGFVKIWPSVQGILLIV